MGVVPVIVGKRPASFYATRVIDHLERGDMVKVMSRGRNTSKALEVVVLVRDEWYPYCEVSRCSVLSEKINGKVVPTVEVVLKPLEGVRPSLPSVSRWDW